MNKNRLEAFSDGVIAIIITIMVFDIKAPSDSSWVGLAEVVPSILTYVMSFLYLGIYWNNHHHMLQVTDRISGTVLWANMHLLFWLTLLPPSTSWMRTSNFAPLPTATYGVVLLFAAAAYRLLESSIINLQGENSRLKEAIGKNWKGNVSLGLYFSAVVLANFYPLAAVAMYSLIAVTWAVPDRRIERLFK